MLTYFDESVFFAHIFWKALILNHGEEIAPSNMEKLETYVVKYGMCKTKDGRAHCLGKCGTRVTKSLHFGKNILESSKPWVSTTFIKPSDLTSGPSVRGTGEKSRYLQE
jgi:hypothetical protein